jgi:hypothetical protein
MKAGKERPRVAVRAQKHLFPNHPLRLVACLRATISPRALLYCDFMQVDILDGRPDNGKATGLGGEHVDLIGALSHITEETLNGIGRLNMPVHRLRKGIKRQEVLFVLSQASYRFPDSAESTWL